MKKINAFPYIGGKFNSVEWLLPLLPKCNTYVEPFGGGMSILLNREPSPVEVYNDLNNKIVNLFKVLRKNPLEFLSLIYLTPYAREEYNTCYNKEYAPNKDSDIERARRTLVLINQSIMARGLRGRKAGWGYTIAADHSSQSLKWNNIITRIMPSSNIL